MPNLTQQERPLAQLHMAGTCTHPLAIDKLEGRFGGQLRRFFCLACEQGWWDSNGNAVRSTVALGLIAMLAETARPRGWQAREAEWRRLENDGLVPTGAGG